MTREQGDRGGDVGGPTRGRRASAAGPATSRADASAASLSLSPSPAEATVAYRVSEPRVLDSGAVFSSPHSGRGYTAAFLASSRLDPMRLRASEDAFVDELFAPAVRYGAPVLAAVAPRAFIDLNRCPTDLDPNLVEGAETRTANARVIAGLGVVPRIVAEGVAIYDGRIPLAEAQARIVEWHLPYHAKLVDLLLRARRSFGAALLIDCHSMPSAALAAGASPRRKPPAADIVLGDRFGAAANPAIMAEIEAAFVAAGFRVARNAPFAGGYITERYGRPAAGVSAVQIEIDRALYLDQSSMTRTAGFDALAGALEPVIARICEVASDPAIRPSPPLAAE